MMLRRTARKVMLNWLCVSLFCAAAVAQQNPPTEPYGVVHGWPVLPENFVLGQISGVAVDLHNHVFVFNRAENSWAADKTHLIPSPAILCFDGATGKLVASWGENRFLEPHGMRVDRSDNIWVTDRGLHQVFKFSHDGKLLMTLGTERVPGLDGTHFNKPTDVAFAADGSFYVSDGYGNSRVAKFSGDGKFLMDWGHKGDGPGEFNLPHNVVVDAQGRVYVADRMNVRIQVFDANGKFLNAWKSEELGRPWGLAIGPDGLLYMVDGGDLKPGPPDRGRILKLDLTGKILAKWSRLGNYDGQIYWGHDIAVGKDGAVYVGDVNHSMRVQKFVPR